jgi:uncharacterized protein YdiU (UPF0061 family)
MTQAHGWQDFTNGADLPFVIHQTLCDTFFDHLCDTQFAMSDPSFPFDNTYARLPEGFFARQSPVPVRAPSLIASNDKLASDMGITLGAESTLAQMLAGNVVPKGAEPLAQLYAGHQFGQFNPQLGDGRALLLGEVVDRFGIRRDIQLKGSGQTPFSRGGDGRAWLGPVLREYVVSEAMAALGIPTTRALAAVRTGDVVYRDGPMPGGVLTRVAGSHIRVGSFQVFAARQQLDHLQQLFDYTVARHDPEVGDPLEFLQNVISRQTDLVARWMAVGFIHGVMNTDNCAISGETIDYGPCAFLDSYHPETVFSSIDRMGRYAYGAQPDVILWNLAQLASALLPLTPDPQAALPDYQAVIQNGAEKMQDAWLRHMAPKIGLKEPRAEDKALIHELLQLMADGGSDFTNTFRALAETGTARNDVANREAYDDWHIKWRARSAKESDPQTVMLNANPAFIPRNHHIEAMIQGAVSGDESLLHKLIAAHESPFDPRPDTDDLRKPPLDAERVSATFCGT